jgi:hypothetical protein
LNLVRKTVGVEIRHSRCERLRTLVRGGANGGENQNQSVREEGNTVVHQLRNAEFAPAIGSM